MKTQMKENHADTIYGPSFWRRSAPAFIVSRSLQTESRVKLAPIYVRSLKQRVLTYPTSNDNRLVNLRKLTDAGMATAPITCAKNQEMCQSLGMFFTYINPTQDVVSTG